MKKNKALDLLVETSSNQTTSLFDENKTAPKRMGRPPKSENKKRHTMFVHFPMGQKVDVF